MGLSVALMKHLQNCMDRKSDIKNPRGAVYAYSDGPISDPLLVIQNSAMSVVADDCLRVTSPERVLVDGEEPDLRRSNKRDGNDITDERRLCEEGKAATSGLIDGTNIDVGLFRVSGGSEYLLLRLLDGPSVNAYG